MNSLNLKDNRLFINGEQKDLFSTAIREIDIQITKESKISAEANKVLHSIIYYLIEIVTRQALTFKSLRMGHYNEEPVLNSRTIQSAVRLLFPIELAKHSVAEGTKAVTRAMSTFYNQNYTHFYDQYGSERKVISNV